MPRSAAAADVHGLEFCCSSRARAGQFSIALFSIQLCHQDCPLSAAAAGFSRAWDLRGHEQGFAAAPAGWLLFWGSDDWARTGLCWSEPMAA